MKTHTVEEAKRRGLIQLTVWVGSDLTDWVLEEYKRLTSLDPTRKVMIVEYRNRFSIYVNDLTDPSR